MIPRAREPRPIVNSGGAQAWPEEAEVGAEVVEKESNRGEKGERGGQRVEGERERERG